MKTDQSAGAALCRGIRGYRDDVDRLAWLEKMGLVAAQFSFFVHAFCQMTNHSVLSVSADTQT